MSLLRNFLQTKDRDMEPLGIYGFLGWIYRDVMNQENFTLLGPLWKIECPRLTYFCCASFGQLDQSFRRNFNVQPTLSTRNSNGLLGQCSLIDHDLKSFVD